MELIGRVVLLALCVLTAYAFPTISDSALVNSFAASNTRDSCTATYLKRINEINNQTVTQTQSCYKSAAIAFKTYDAQVLNMTVAEVNVYSKNLQMSLANCSAKDSNRAILDCYLLSFDQNLGNLYNLTSKSQLVANSVNDYEYEVEVATRMCVNKVMIGSRTNSTAVNVDLQICLANTSVGQIDGLKPGNKTKALN